MADNKGMPELPSAPPPPAEVQVRTMRSDLESMARSGGMGAQFKTVQAPRLPLKEEDLQKKENPLLKTLGVKGQAPAPQPPPENEGSSAPAKPWSPPEIPGVPQHETVPEAPTPGGPHAGMPAEAGPASGVEAPKRKNLSLLLLALAGIVVLAAGAYFAYAFLFANKGGTPAPTAPSAAAPSSTSPSIPVSLPPSASTSVPAPAAPVSATPQNLVHASFFGKPADRTFSLTLGGTVQNAANLETYSQRFSKLFTELPASSSAPAPTFFEIDMKNADGNAATAEDVFSAADIAVLDPTYLSAHFEPDITVFAEKNAQGVWPGYILKLKASENWLYLKDDVAKLEQKTGQIDNLFLGAHGNPAGGFNNVALNGISFRELPYTAPGAAFVYGWTRGYLVMSTSVNGLSEALNRL